MTSEINYDADLLADAQKILGTGSAEETIREAMREVLRKSPPFKGHVLVVDGTITLPQQLIVRYSLDEVGAQVELTENKGVILLHPRPAA